MIAKHSIADSIKPGKARSSQRGKENVHFENDESNNAHYEKLSSYRSTIPCNSKSNLGYDCKKPFSHESSPIRNYEFSVRSPKTDRRSLSHSIEGQRRANLKSSLQRMFQSKRRDAFPRSNTPSRSHQSQNTSTNTSPDRSNISIESKMVKLKHLLTGTSASSSTFTNQKKVEKYLRYDHAFYQVSRILHGVLHRNVLHAFDHISLTSRQDGLGNSQLLLQQVLLAANLKLEKVIIHCFRAWRHQTEIQERKLNAAKSLASTLKQVLNNLFSLTCRQLITNQKNSVKISSSLLAVRQLQGTRGAAKLFECFSKLISERQAYFMKSLYSSVALAEKNVADILDGFDCFTAAVHRMALTRIRLRARRNFHLSILLKKLATLCNAKKTHSFWIAFSTIQLHAVKKHNVSITSNLALGRFISIFESCMSRMKLQTFKKLEVSNQNGLIGKYSLARARLPNKLRSLYQGLQSIGFKKIRDVAMNKKRAASLYSQIAMRLLTRRKSSVFTTLVDYYRISHHFECDALYFRHKLQKSQENSLIIRETASLALSKAGFIILNRVVTDLLSRHKLHSFALLRSRVVYNNRQVFAKTEQWNAKLQSVQALVLKIQNISAIKQLKRKQHLFSKLKARARSNNNKYMALMLKCNLLESTLSKVVARKRSIWLHQFQLALITRKHQRAFLEHQRLAKIHMLMKKSRVLKISQAFMLWRTDLEICRAEWEITRRALSQKKIEDEKTFKEIGDLLEEVCTSNKIFHKIIIFRSKDTLTSHNFLVVAPRFKKGA